jgi:hypothetical protein
VKFPEENTAAAFNDEATLDNGSCDDSFWNKSQRRGLLVIATSYRHGIHVAKRPKEFLPAIDQLEQLHEAGFVHGDIRAFNTVFGEEGQGGLIDFDFGGRLGRLYPNGYRPVLADGNRLGDGEAGAENNTIFQWHDWYALGRLIFSVHTFGPPGGEDEEHLDELLLVPYRMERLWKRIDSDPTREDIEALRRLLYDLDDQGWTVRPDRGFEIELKKTGALTATKRGATGSPPEKNVH